MDTDNSISTPDGKSYDMTLPNQAEARVQEIAYVTRPKAPELISVFARACFVLSRHLTSIYLGHQMAIKAAANRRAVLLIDVIPGILAEKKLTSNDANRNSLITLDPEYDRLSTAEVEFEAALLYVKRKIEDMESALNATKKVVGETDAVYNRPNYNWAETGDLQPKPTQEVGGLKFGKPNY